MIKLLQKFFAPSTKQIVEDTDLYSVIIDLRQRVENLEKENVETCNALYEIENRLESKINNIHPVVYNIRKDVQ